MTVNTVFEDGLELFVGFFKDNNKGKSEGIVVGIRDSWDDGTNNGCNEGLFKGSNSIWLIT